MVVDFVEVCDHILVMSVEPGFGGQAFIEQALIKLRQLREMTDARNPRCDIEVDGDDPSAALRDMRRRMNNVR